MTDLGSKIPLDGLNPSHGRQAYEGLGKDLHLHTKSSPVCPDVVVEQASKRTCFRSRPFRSCTPAEPPHAEKRMSVRGGGMAFVGLNGEVVGEP